jgi:hypothetical protein
MIKSKNVFKIIVVLIAGLSLSQISKGEPTTNANLINFNAIESDLIIDYKNTILLSPRMPIHRNKKHCK